MDDGAAGRHGEQMRAQAEPEHGHFPRQSAAQELQLGLARGGAPAGPDPCGPARHDDGVDPGEVFGQVVFAGLVDAEVQPGRCQGRPHGGGLPQVRAAG